MNHITFKCDFHLLPSGRLGGGSTLYIYAHTRVRMHFCCIFTALLLLFPSVSFAQEEQQRDSIATDTLSVDSLCHETDSLPWPQSLQRRIDRIIEESSFLKSSQLGMMIYDITADSVLYAVNEKHAMRPASTMKVITAITALDKLGGSYQFKTYLRYTGEAIDSIRTLNGDVYVVGGMDPRLNRDDVIAFVESLMKLGIDTIRGNIYADKSLKDSDLLGEGWCWDDDNPVLTPLLYGEKEQLMERFRQELETAGVTHIGSYGENTAPSTSEIVCMRSHSIDQILTRMLKDSDNLFAESLFYQFAATRNRPANAADGREVEQALIRKMKLSPSDYRIADGSGLSLYNYVSPELEVAFLRYAKQNAPIFNHLFSSLPVAGVDGTLSKRMKGTTAAENVHAKTGTVTGVSSLAGYATADNYHLLAFCIINQGVLSGSEARAFQDKICVEMTEK